MLYLLSPPRVDWRVHGRANVFARSSTTTSTPAPTPPGAALREWLALADAVVAAGADIAILPWSDEEDGASLTGMPYTAEAGVLAGGSTFILPNVKPAHRVGERAHIERFARDCGLATHALPADVLWEGQGDVIDVGAGRFLCTSGEGPAARTSRDAYAHIAPLLGGPSLHVRFRAEPWFHGNTFLASFHDGAGGGRVVVVCPDALLASTAEGGAAELARLRTFLGDGCRIIPITRAESLQYATNALQVNRRVLAPRHVARDVPAVGAAWRELGLEVVELDFPVLFGRGGGAAVCMTNALHGLAVDDIPARHRWSTARPLLVNALASVDVSAT